MLSNGIEYGCVFLTGLTIEVKIGLNVHQSSRRGMMLCSQVLLYPTVSIISYGLTPRI